MNFGRTFKALFALGALLAVFAPAASAMTLSAGSSETGWVSASVEGAAPGGSITLAELRDGVAFDFVTLSAGTDGAASQARALPWRCESRTRELVARDATGATASVQLTTPSCKKRLGVQVRPAKTRAGQKVVVSLRDNWRLGDRTAELCAIPAGGLGRQCQSVKLAAGASVRKRSVRVASAGRWTFRVAVPGGVVKRSVKARPRSGRLRVLAAGDSMIQYVDQFLKGTLKRWTPLRFKTDDHISTGISKPQLLNWPRRAASTARSFKPDVTVMFIGANDGFNMPTPGGRTVTCCGEGWVDEYARRTLKMMRSYERRGAGHVYWLLLPAPRGGSWREIFRGVNQGILQAAERSERTHVVDLRRTFSPGGRFRQSIRWKGRTVGVRAADGVHLNPAGARIAASIVARRMRADGVASR